MAYCAKFRLAGLLEVPDVETILKPGGSWRELPPCDKTVFIVFDEFALKELLIVLDELLFNL